MHKPLGILGSSQNPEQLAASISGLLIGSASLIVLALGHLGFSVTVEQVTTYAGALGTAVGAIVTTYGLMRKLIIAIHDRLA